MKQVCLLHQTLNYLVLVFRWSVERAVDEVLFTQVGQLAGLEEVLTLQSPGLKIPRIVLLILLDTFFVSKATTYLLNLHIKRFKRETK